MLQNFVSLGGSFNADCLCTCLKSRVISLKILQKVLPHVDRDSCPQPLDVYLQQQPAAVIESILDHFSTSMDEKSEPFSEFTKVKLGGTDTYRGYSINNYLGFHTKHKIDQLIDLMNLGDTEELRQNALQEYSDILSHEYLFATTPSPVHIVNIPGDKFQLHYVNLVNGTHEMQDFDYALNVIDEVKKFVYTQLQTYTEGIKLLNEAFPDEKLEIIGHGAAIRLFGKVFDGIPTVAHVQSHVNKEKCYEDARKEGFEVKKFDKGTFSEIIENWNGRKTLFDLQGFKVFANKGLMMPCGASKDIAPLTVQIKDIFEAASGTAINEKSAKEIVFPEEKMVIHDRLSGIDLDQLNKLLKSYKDSDYLKKLFLANPDITYDELSSALNNVVALCKQGKKIKDLNEEDSRTLTLQLSHVLKRLMEGDQECLCRFVCDLSLDAILCGRGIARRVSSEYKAVFNIIQQSDSLSVRTLDSLLIALYGGASKETLETMTNCVMDPDQREQTMHMGSYLRGRLKNLINLPVDPLTGTMYDQYIAGNNDIPSDKVFQHYKAFFLPLLIQRLKSRCSLRRAMYKSRQTMYKKLLIPILFFRESVIYCGALQFCILRSVKALAVRSQQKGPY